MSPPATLLANQSFGSSTFSEFELCTIPTRVRPSFMSQNTSTAPLPSGLMVCVPDRVWPCCLRSRQLRAAPPPPALPPAAAFLLTLRASEATSSFSSLISFVLA